ncbi:hypothetical protein [Bythopirellula goksoeyrii]|uniref:Uncharacterized protein n=1 Tax=Bythopirellula goksoeyrii TaxID=1400387 RepID=A0A5B9Q8N5_9BACT|nr:hypothetical protein [Bythopirellula goksoeyrii]QEG35268.1 hypothetical protein Pr1d_25630 [Bythopirellula goksoeyrii]
MRSIIISSCVVLMNFQLICSKLPAEDKTEKAERVIDLVVEKAPKKVKNNSLIGEYVDNRIIPFFDLEEVLSRSDDWEVADNDSSHDYKHTKTGMRAQSRISGDHSIKNPRTGEKVLEVYADLSFVFEIDDEEQKKVSNELLEKILDYESVSSKKKIIRWIKAGAPNGDLKLSDERSVSMWFSKGVSGFTYSLRIAHYMVDEDGEIIRSNLGRRR